MLQITLHAIGHGEVALQLHAGHHAHLCIYPGRHMADSGMAEATLGQGSPEERCTMITELVELAKGRHVQFHIQLC